MFKKIKNIGDQKFCHSLTSLNIDHLNDIYICFSKITKLIPSLCEKCEKCHAEFNLINVLSNIADLLK